MDLTALAASLSELVLERLADGRFVRRGAVPGWCADLHCDEVREEQPFAAERVFPFLATFLPRAEEAWRHDSALRIDSDFWTEVGSSGEELHLEATAVRAGSSAALVIWRNEALFVQKQLVLQRARELRMTHHALTREIEKKDVLVHTIVHDLSAPLHSVLGALSLLDEAKLDEPGSQWTKLALSAAMRQRQLIAEILDVFSMEQGAMGQLSRGGDDAPDVLQTAERVIAESESVARRRDIRVELHRSSCSEASPCRAVAEESRLFRVLANLVDNALRCSPGGGVVSIDVSRGDRDVIVTVEDEGPGVPPDLLPELFAKFAKGRGRGAGTGLGLYFCRITVEGWGGRIGYEERRPHGARFWVRMIAANGSGAPRPPAGSRELGHG